MTAETVTVDPELARAALADVLDEDAARTPAAAPPPRRSPPADATPDAPWGFKADGTARKGPPGPGRPRKDPASAARTEAPSSTTPSSPSSTSAPAGADPARSYATEVNDALAIAWMVMAAVPFTKPQAAVLHDGIPAMVPAWDRAAQKNATVRSYVLKLSGEGSWTWIVPVVMTSLPVVLGMWQALSASPETRAALKEQTDKDLEAFLLEQLTAAGVEIPSQNSAEESTSSAESQQAA